MLTTHELTDSPQSLVPDSAVGEYLPAELQGSFAIAHESLSTPAKKLWGA